MKRRFIGAVAREFGLNPRTLRYYEGLRLLPVLRRSEGGYRLYDEEAERQLAFIIKARSLGLTLREIRQVVMLGDRGDPPCNSVGRILRDHIRRIDHQMAQLRELRVDLRAMEAQCQRNLQSDNGRAGQNKALCPVIETLGNGKRNRIRSGGIRQ